MDLIDEFLDFDDWAALARHLNCSVFDLLERPDREAWMEHWKRRDYALSEMRASAEEERRRNHGR